MGGNTTEIHQPDPVTPASEEYADQIGVFRQIEQDKLNRQAQAWNQQANDLSDQFSGFNQQANELFGTIQGLDMTADIDSYRSQLNDLQSQFGSIDWTLDRPEFQTTFNGINLYGDGGGDYTPNFTNMNESREAFGADQSSGLLDLSWLQNVDLPNFSDSYAPGQDINSWAQYQNLVNNGYDYNDITPGGRFIDVTVGLNNPTLVDGINDFDLGQLNSLFQRGNDYLNQLAQKRAAEEARISNFTQDMRSQLQSYNTLLGGYDIDDANRLNQLQQNVGFTLEDINNFDSKLDTDFSSLLSGYDQLNAGIQDLYGQRDNELARISEFEQGLLGGLGDLESQVGNLSIADFDQMEALRKQYEDRISNANQFDSELDFDLSDELEKIKQSRAGLDSLFGQREAELGRIEEFEGSLADRIRQINSLAGSTGIYNLDDITNLQSFLDQAGGQMEGFESALDYDFGDQQFDLQMANRQIENLLNQRSNTLDSMFSAGNSLLTDMGGVAEYDEASIRNLLNLAREGQQGAGQFTGGRAEELQGLYEGSVDDLNSKLSNIFSQRDTIEGDLATMLENARNQDILDLDQLGGLESELAGLQSLKNQWGATQANDEYAALQSLLGGERSRLERDASNVSQQQQMAMQEILSQLDANGNLSFNDLSFRDPMTQSAYQQMVQQGFINPEDEEEARRQLQSAFARNLGIIQG